MAGAALGALKGGLARRAGFRQRGAGAQRLGVEPQFQQRQPARGLPTGKGSGEILLPGNGFAMAAIGAGQRGEIRVRQIGAQTRPGKLRS